MSIASKIGKVARSLLPVAIGLSLSTYFGYHAVYGARGMQAIERLDERITAANEVLALELQRRAALERRVALLRPNSLDPDLLEERARNLLSVGRADEVILLDAPREPGKRPVRVTSP